MRKVPDWSIQVAWWVSGIFATGGLWYFLSIKNYAFTIACGIGAVVAAAIAVALHRAKDRADTPKVSKVEPMILQFGEEQVTFTELVRTNDYDIVKVNAHTHKLGVAAEHIWLKRRYPSAKMRTQALTTLKGLAPGAKGESAKVHFDVINIEFEDGREKDVYFDISNFFTCAGALLDGKTAVATKLRQLYNLH